MNRPPAAPGDRYAGDVLGAVRRRVAAETVPATADVVAEDPLTGFCGQVVACSGTDVTLEDRHGKRRVFALAGAFLIDGRPARLVKPPRVDVPTGPRLTASGSIAVAGGRAQVAKASRIWVEGIHDATLLERVWGDDLRVEGIVVEPIDGLDNLPAALNAFRPGPGRRVGVLVDHLVDGSKEQRIAAAVADPHVLVTGHPYIDVWQAVRPQVIGIAAWPAVPRSEDWKSGACRRLGVADPAAMWGRINGAVRGAADLETPLRTAVEQLIDFVTAD